MIYPLNMVTFHGSASLLECRSVHELKGAGSAPVLRLDAKSRDAQLGTSAWFFAPGALWGPHRNDGECRGKLSQEEVELFRLVFFKKIRHIYIHIDIDIDLQGLFRICAKDDPAAEYRHSFPANRGLLSLFLFGTGSKLLTSQNSWFKKLEKDQPFARPNKNPTLGCQSHFSWCLQLEDLRLASWKRIPYVKMLGKNPSSHGTENVTFDGFSKDCRRIFVWVL